MPVALLLCALAFPIVARVVVGPRGAAIHVRWAQPLDAPMRQQLEARFRLMDGQRMDSSTWRYDLADPSTENIRRIISDAAVEDTDGLDRARFSLGAAVRTGRRLRSGSGDAIVFAVDRVALVLAALAAIVGLPGASGGAFSWKRAGATVAVRVRSLTLGTPRAATTSASALDLGPVRPRLWTAVTLAAAAPFVITLCVTLWETPIPISEAVALFEDVLEQPLALFWSPNDTYYRPLFHVALAALWRIGDLDATLGSIKLLTIIPIVVLVSVFVWHLRPRTALDAAAALVAVTVLIGSAGFRDNLEVVLPYTIVGMCMAAIVWAILEREPRRWTCALVVVCALVAIGFKEQGLVILPVIVVAWWSRAPGATRGLAITAVFIGVAYVAFRLSGSAAWAPFEQDLGLGFSEIDRRDAAARFGAFPYWIYAYNSASTISGVLFSEPSRGVFQAVRAFLVERDPQPGLVVDVASSCVLTLLIAGWGLRGVAAARRGEWSPEGRLFLATVAALLASGALSFNYSRERLGGMAVVFYAMAAFHAVRAASSQLVQVARVRLGSVALVLILLSGGWSIRAIATLEWARGHSWSNQREWFVMLPEREISFARRPTYQRLLTSMTEQGRVPSAPRPTPYPDWFARLIGQLR